jgi:hypothetical protein
VSRRCVENGRDTGKLTRTPLPGEGLCDDPPARRGGRAKQLLATEAYRTAARWKAAAMRTMPPSTPLYDRRRNEVSLDEVERIAI